MEMPASIENKFDRRRLYPLAKEFMKLDYQQKFTIGFDLKLIEEYDAHLDEAELEEKIFREVLDKKIIEKFLLHIDRAKYG